MRHKNIASETVFGVLAIGLGSLMPLTAHAGAWTAKKGDTYLKGAVNYFDTSSRFGDDLPDFENFQDLNFSVYVEHGLQDNLTLFSSTAFKDIEQTSAGVTTSNSGLGDVDIGLRYNLKNAPAVISLQGLVKLPYLYSETADLPLGNGQVDVEGKVLVGKSLGPLGYFGLEAGYRYRAEAPVDEFRYLVEYGFDLNENIYLRTKLDGTLGLGNVSEGASLENVSVPGNPFSGINDAIVNGTNNSLNASLPLKFDLGRLEYTAGYKFGSGWAAEVTGTTNVYGDNTLKGTNIQFAIVSQF